MNVWEILTTFSQKGCLPLVLISAKCKFCLSPTFIHVCVPLDHTMVSFVANIWEL